MNVSRIKLIGCFCFCLSAIACITFFVTITQNYGSFLYLFIGGLWYQVGTSFLKRKKWSWYACVVLFGLFCVGNLDTVYGAIIRPLFVENMTGVGYGRWVALLLFIVSALLIKALFNPAIKKEFKINT